MYNSRRFLIVFFFLLHFRTIICRKTGSKQQSVKAIDVKIETDPFVNDQYDAFCVKDEGQHWYTIEIMRSNCCLETLEVLPLIFLPLRGKVEILKKNLYSNVLLCEPTATKTLVAGNKLHYHLSLLQFIKLKDHCWSERYHFGVQRTYLWKMIYVAPSEIPEASPALSTVTECNSGIWLPTTKHCVVAYLSVHCIYMKVI